MKQFLCYPLMATLCVLPATAEQVLCETVTHHSQSIVIAQVGYTVTPVEMIADHGFDTQAGAFRGIFLFQGKKFVAWYSSQPNVSIGRHLQLTHLEQPDGNWYSLYDPATEVTAYVTKVQPL